MMELEKFMEENNCADYLESLRLAFKRMKEGYIYPGTKVQDEAWPGYWDKKGGFDVRTQHSSLDKGYGCCYIENENYIVWVSHDTTGCCPSGQCGWAENINFAIKKDAFKKRFKGVVIKPYPNQSIKLVVKNHEKFREIPTDGTVWCCHAKGDFLDFALYKLARACYESTERLCPKDIPPRESKDIFE